MFDRAIAAATVGMVLGLAPLSVAEAQDWRTVSSFRQHADESKLDVELRYGAGRLVVRPGPAGELYRLGIRYDSDVFDPLTEYRDGRLKVGVEGTGRSIRLRNREAGEMSLALSPDLPLDLALAFGAVEAELELGGLHVSRVKIETGASDTQVRFSHPNRTACHRFELSMGAAAFRATGLGNANCDRIRAEGGVGDMNLDFSGEWRQNVSADITMALGAVTLLVPEDVGVVVRRSTFLTSFAGRDFDRRGRDHYSDNWDRAERRLTVELQGAFGSVTVRRIGPSSPLATP
jgi:hypothetical protein